MSLQNIHLWKLLTDHIINGGGNSAFPVKGGIVGIGIEIRLLNIDIGIAYKPISLPALHHQTVVLNHLIRILLGKGRKYIRILFDNLNVFGKAVVFIKEILNHLILLTGLDDPIDGHILLQGIYNYLRITGNGIKLRSADVKFRK